MEVYACFGMRGLLKLKLQRSVQPMHGTSGKLEKSPTFLFGTNDFRSWLGCRGSRKPGLRAPLFSGRQHPPWPGLSRRLESLDSGTAVEKRGRFRATSGSRDSVPSV